MNEKELRQFCMELNNKMFKETVENMCIGRRYILDGEEIEIVDGQLYGSYGGWSNFWYWKKMLKSGELSKRLYHGYGGSSEVFIPKEPKHKKD